MAKIISTAISILLLVVAEQAALQWKRMRSGANEDGHLPDSIQLNDFSSAIRPQDASFTNIVPDDAMVTGRP